MQVAKNFDIREFVSPLTYNTWGARCIWFVDKRVISTAQFAKDFFTNYYATKFSNVEKVTVTLNNWLWGGNKIGRGYREPEQYTTGQFKNNPLSESLHRQGKAEDMVVTVHFNDGEKVRIPTKELLTIIFENWDQWQKTGVTAAEHWDDAPTWLHLDFRNTGTNELLIFEV